MEIAYTYSQNDNSWATKIPRSPEYEVTDVVHSNRKELQLVLNFITTNSKELTIALETRSVCFDWLLHFATNACTDAGPGGSNIALSQSWHLLGPALVFSYIS